MRKDEVVAPLHPRIYSRVNWGFGLTVDLTGWFPKNIYVPDDSRRCNKIYDLPSCVQASVPSWSARTIPGTLMMFSWPEWNKNLGHVMRKPVDAICEQQKSRSAYASAQSDQRLYCSLPGLYNTHTWYSHNFKTITSLCSWAGRFESDLVGNSEYRFSLAAAHILFLLDVYSFVNYGCDTEEPCSKSFLRFDYLWFAFPLCLVFFLSFLFFLLPFVLSFFET